MQSVNIELFQRCVAFTITIRRWGNRRKASMDSVDTHGADKELLRLSKQLIVADEYDAIVSHENETRNRIMAMSVPSFFKKGIQLISTEAIEKVEQYLTSRVEEHRQLVIKFAQVYPDKILEAQQRLGNQFNAGDYIPVNQLVQMFQVNWNWIAFGIPENLPQQLFEAEKAKAEAQWKEAGDQITLCLRQGFHKLVAAMVDRLTTNPGEDKKIFKNTLIGNLTDFLDMFQARNITNDSELAALVEQAKEVIGNTTPDDLRSDEELRAKIAADFATLEASLNDMITSMPARKFNFEEEA